MTILQKIQEHSILSPSKIAIYEGDNAVTYSQLWAAICNASVFFSSWGNRGDRLILVGEKSASFVYAYFGSQMAGIIPITVDPEINSTRMQRIMQVVSPIGIWGHLSSKQYEMHEYPDFLACPDTVIRNINFPNPDDISDILFTTGTTGMPKGVVLTFQNEWAAATNINTFIDNTADEIELLALPISHSFGLGRLRCTLQKGATIDLLGSFASMKKFFQEIEKRQITGFGMVPASWNYICKMSGEKIAQYAPQIRYIEIGSAFMPIEEKKRLLRIFPHTRICMHYGLTEASRSAFICFNEDNNHLESIGKPAPNTDIQIFSEDGIPCRDGEEGEICVKGEHICSNYWGNCEQEYKSAFYGDYFRTGDWGFRTQDGYLYLKSRKKELINVGGKKVSPIEVEEVLNEIPGIVESACIGKADNVLGEVVKAFLVVDKGVVLDVDALQKSLFGKLENYKVPVEFEIIDSLPKTMSGKLQRLELKKRVSC